VPHFTASAPPTESDQSPLKLQRCVSSVPNAEIAMNATAHAANLIIAHFPIISPRFNFPKFAPLFLTAGFDIICAI
jgi:hypothetical protein